jgi:hypothetical protein
MRYVATISICAAPFLLFTVASAQTGAQASAKPIIDNEIVRVWDTEKSLPPAQHDFVAVSLVRKGTATLGHAGDTPGENGSRTIVIELKDHAALVYPNTTGFPPAFPRARVEKLIENDRLVVWGYHWNPGEPTPMHFHDKDVVVVYEEPTNLKSITPDGKSVENDYKFADVRFNRGNRTHYELLVGPSGSAVMTELK